MAPPITTELRPTSQATRAIDDVRYAGKLGTTLEVRKDNKRSDQSKAGQRHDSPGRPSIDERASAGT
jgi:hypothetical protein